ncbi:hypothetical protein Plec18167_006928 [Paecilomyces lecythidis]|uniref:Uncharacterized protein n=1 Tax=Paecilomyces lecythidis TaxID=3004212 RepID=A0ABR3X774_9EURO
MRFFDVAVTFTADQFHGLYRGGKKYHDPDFSEVLQRAQEYGCEKLLLTTMNLAGAEENLRLVREFPTMCKMTLGVHPYHAAEIYEQTTTSTTTNSSPEAEKGLESGPNAYLSSLRKMCEELLSQDPSPLVSFGEIGLDYVYLERADKATQQRAFREQLDLAVQFQLPLFLHVRESTDDFISIIKPYLPLLPRGGLVHSFAGTKDEMLRLVELGLDISVNGISFRTDEQLEMVRRIPLDRLQLETDAPWCEVLSNDAKIAPYLAHARTLPPSRKHDKFLRGQMVKTRNEPCTIERVALVVAGLKGLGVEEVAEAAWNNSIRMFWK